MPELPDMTSPAYQSALQIAQQIISLEAALLDERRWDEWLALLLPDCEYWVPTWLSEAALATDPETQLSHIYYASRAPLVDRIQRIQSARAAAVVPLRRSAHALTNTLLEAWDGEHIDARSVFTCHNYDPRGNTVDVLFGWTRHRLRRTPEGWRIARKKIGLMNDTLPSSVDIYSL